MAGSTDNNMESLVEYHKEMVSKKNDSMGESVEPEALNKESSGHRSESPGQTDGERF